MGPAFDVFRAGELLRQLLLPCPPQLKEGEGGPRLQSELPAVCRRAERVIASMLEPLPQDRPDMSSAVRELRAAVVAAAG